MTPEELNAVANDHFYYSRYPEAEAAATEALALARAAAEKKQEAKALNILGNTATSQGNYRISLDMYRQALLLYEEIHDISGMAGVTSNMGLAYENLSDYPRALEYLGKALAACEELGDKSGMIIVIGNIGNVYRAISDYPRALEYYTKALAAHEELGQKSGAAIVIGNIGNVYTSLADYPRALEYYTKALAAHEELGQKSGVARTIGNIGNVYYYLAKYQNALEYFGKALVAHEELGEKSSVARDTSNIGNVYQDISDYPRALEYFDKARAVYEELGQTSGAARVVGNIGVLYGKQDFDGQDPAKAEEYLLRAKAMNEELGTKEQLFMNHQNLAALYEQQNRWREAYTHFKIYIELKDEVLSENAKKQAVQLANERRQAELEKQLIAEYARLEEREKVIKELTALNEALNEANRVKNEVIGIVAHDLKNPLSGILLIAENIGRYLSRLSVADVKEQFARIAAAAGKMNDLVINLLDIQRLDNGKYEMELVAVPALELIHSLTEAYTPPASAKNIEIIPPAIVREITIIADRTALTVVLDNLLSNAVKFSPFDSEIRVSVAVQAGSRVRIGIKDQGPGLTSADKEKIFGEFMRLSAKPTGGEHSTGLGLSIVKKMVELMGGAVWCESEGENGAEFIVELPGAEREE